MVHVLAPGCIKELDKLSEKFVSDQTQRKDILKETDEFINKITSEEVSELNQLALN